MIRALVLLYDQFCMHEIACTCELIQATGGNVQTCGKTCSPIEAEEGFHVLANLQMDEVDLSKYDCLILPGIATMFDTLKQKEYVDFLAQCKYYPSLLIAAISSSPALLGAAGLLDGHNYCGGLYDEIIHDLPFLDEAHFVPTGLIQDGNVITAVGYAFREFAYQICDHFHIKVDRSYFGTLAISWKDKETHWHLPKEAIALWEDTLKELKVIYQF